MEDVLEESFNKSLRTPRLSQSDGRLRVQLVNQGCSSCVCWEEDTIDQA